MSAFGDFFSNIGNGILNVVQKGGSLIGNAISGYSKGGILGAVGSVVDSFSDMSDSGGATFNKVNVNDPEMVAKAQEVAKIAMSKAKEVIKQQKSGGTATVAYSPVVTANSMGNNYVKTTRFLKGLSLALYIN